MAIILEPKSNGFTTNSGQTISTNSYDLPLGQKPEGDELDKALLKLENVIHTLNSKMNALEENIKKLEEGSKKIEYHVFNLVNAKKPLVLTPDMEINTPSKTTTISLKDLVKEGNNGHK
jgi:exonuclease VII small subunit